MNRFAWLSLAGVAAIVLAACSRPAPPSPQFRPTATIKDIMDSIVDPSADALWDAVATTVSAAGIEEKRPRTEDEWTNVRRKAIALVEATNLLLMEGRRVAKPGDKAENEEVELSPAEIEATIAADRQSWATFVGKLHDAATIELKATEDRNADALLDAGEVLDTACETCHLKYWYPPSKQAEKAREGAASPRK